jgi:hypothetical protein
VLGVLQAHPAPAHRAKLLQRQNRSPLLLLHFKTRVNFKRRIDLLDASPHSLPMTCKFEFKNQDTRHVIAGILKDATYHPYKAWQVVYE